MHYEARCFSFEATSLADYQSFINGLFAISLGVMWLFTIMENTISHWSTCSWIAGTLTDGILRKYRIFSDEL